MQHAQGVSTALAFWWLVGACCETFGGGAFTTTSNGYFATWACCGIATLWAAESWGRKIDSGVSLTIEDSSASLAVVDMEYNTHMLLVFVASGVVLGMIISFGATHGNGLYGEAHAQWQLACSIISLILCIGVFALPKLGQEALVASAAPYVALFLSIWWFFGAIIGTFFYANFQTTNNGYFACWVAFGAAFAAA